MTRGVVLIARNNKEIDYIKQAVFLSSRISHYLDLPVSLITGDTKYVEDNYSHTFDNIIEVKKQDDFTHKSYCDGSSHRTTLEFKNTDRTSVYDLTPYDETLVLDTDYIISDSKLLQCFDQMHDFLAFDAGVEISGWRDISEFDFITPTGPKFYWATAFFFRKSNTTEVFFDLLKHIQENYYHYRYVYQIPSTVMRNDFIFSIAIHVMNGYTGSNNFVKPMPGKLYYSVDRDTLIELTGDKFVFLVEKQNKPNEHFVTSISGRSVHVMNKYSLSRVIDYA